MTSTAPGRWAHRWSEGWRLATCLVLGMALFAVVWAPVFSTPEPSPRQGVLMALDALLGLVGLPLVLFRRRSPVLIASLLVMLAVISSWLTPAQVWAVGHLAARRRMRELVVVGALWCAGLVANERYIARAIQPDVPLSLPVLLVFGMLSYVAVAAIGWNLGARRALHESWRVNAESARREQVARVAQAQTAERARIAREMHDVLAHKISLVSLHAGVLAYQDALSDAERKQTATLIQTTAHQALEELRTVLGVLRADDHEALSPPQPSLLDLPALLAQEEAAGALVSLQVADGFWREVSTLPETTSRHAHRIVQECLTNARKHAPGQPVTVQGWGMPGAGLQFVVSNRLARRDSGVPGSRMGLAGLAERASLAGGSLTVEEREGHFVVHAHLPWPAAGGSHGM